MIRAFGFDIAAKLPWFGSGSMWLEDVISFPEPKRSLMPLVCATALLME